MLLRENSVLLCENLTLLHESLILLPEKIDIIMWKFDIITRKNWHYYVKNLTSLQKNWHYYVKNLTLLWENNRLVIPQRRCQRNIVVSNRFTTSQQFAVRLARRCPAWTDVQLEGCVNELVLILLSHTDLKICPDMCVTTRPYNKG